ADDTTIRPVMSAAVHVFLDLTADGEPFGRLVFELRKDICPKTAENFRALCTGEKGFGYKGCIFYRIIPGFCACSGDFETNNADRRGGRSIFGEKYFEDENFELQHDSRGVLSMDNYGWPDTVSSRFFVTFDEAPWLNDYHVAFGKLVDGWDTLEKLESYGTIEGYGVQKGKTTAEIRISNCGEIR
uniref:Peptidyl-prolyl cis-trans isomerase n=1 Tax=Parascaris univalens TaxID=6257 RepID=A0A915BDY2_PARUN